MVIFLLFSSQVQAPPKVISSLPVPGTESICFHPVKVISNHEEGRASGDGIFPVKELNFFCQLNQINSNFTEVSHVNIT